MLYGVFSVVKKAIRTGVFDFGDAIGFFFDKLVEKGKEWVQDFDLEETSHKLTPLDLRQIIKEEIQLLSQKHQTAVIQEGWFLPALAGILMASIGTVLGTAVIVTSPITHKILDWAAEWIETDWPKAATYIKTRISDSILEGIGYDGNERTIV